MAETVEVDFSELHGATTVAEAACLWAGRQEKVPTWNQWVSLVSQLRRHFPEDPIFAGVHGRSAIANASHQLL